MGKDSWLSSLPRTSIKPGVSIIVKTVFFRMYYYYCNYYYYYYYFILYFIFIYFLNVVGSIESTSLRAATT